MRFLLFLLFSLSVNSCAQPLAQNDFYHGLLSRAQAHDSAEAVKHFEKALASSNVYVRRAAAEELANLMYHGAEFSAATGERIRREADGYWSTAFDAVNKTPDKEKVLKLLLGFEQGAAVPNEARLYTLRECEKQGVFFTETESAAIDGKFASLRSRYNEALVFFRAFQEDGEWPAQIPALFIQYPNLINDLGRAFQYTAFISEGLDLFLRWEKNLKVETLDAPASSAAQAMEGLRFRLLFYAARIARRAGRVDQAISLFEQARTLAPEAEQADACIWYILDSSLSGIADVFIQRLERFIPYWHKDSYFDDVLEKFLQALASKREWEKLLRTFSLIRGSGAAVSKAGYAWVIARTIEEGCFSDEEMRLAAQAAGSAADMDASVFMRIAYNAGDTSYYYRSQSAAVLGEPFLELQAEISAAGKGRASAASKASPALQFLLGFFSGGAAEFSPRYIRQLEKELSVDELRAVAHALAQAGMYAQSMRLVSLYINADSYVSGRWDMELLFPRPYSELVEKYAAETGIAPALLYGLIRTESAFQSDIVSSAGAVGLTQLMPATAQEMAGRIRRTGGADYTAAENGIDLSDPALNIHIGSYYLNYLIGRFEDTLISLLAYNGGMNRVRRWRSANTLPPDLFLETIAFPETRDYGRKVMAAAAVYEELYYRNH